ncbi:MAG: 50S ribosomal protein L2, partial [Candidatus Omnitrophica bacterium]|nr:50S ribosomal protein L2 [Candidatus Omnitrophota bacterium]
MGLKKFKPTTPSRRWMVLSDFSEITKEEPEKSLIVPLK